MAIARALAMQPRAILFDEPTSALDPRMTAEVLAVLADLAKAGQTMVVVTHAMNVARSAAPTVHVFETRPRPQNPAPRNKSSNPPAFNPPPPNSSANTALVAKLPTNDRIRHVIFDMGNGTRLSRMFATLCRIII